jgi:hypothetical protein
VVKEEVADFTAPGFPAPDALAMIAHDNALKLFPRRGAVQLACGPIKGSRMSYLHPSVRVE